MTMFKAVLFAMSLSLGWAVQTNSGCTCADECADPDGGGKWCDTKPGCDYSWDYCGDGAEREGPGMGSLADEIADSPAPPPSDDYYYYEGGGDISCASCGTNEQLSKDEIELALNLQNKMRASVGAPALKWNCDLMCQVQQHADNCAFQHSDSFSAPIPAGENLASGDDGAQAAWMWFSEYGAAYGGQADFNCCGHYTAMVWKATKEIGCGKCSGTVYLCQYAHDKPNFGGASDFATNVPSSNPSYTNGLDKATARQMFNQFSSWGFADMPSLYDADVDMPRQGGGLFSIAAVPFMVAGFLMVVLMVALVVKRGRARSVSPGVHSPVSTADQDQQLNEKSELIQEVDQECPE